MQKVLDEDAFAHIAADVETQSGEVVAPKLDNADARRLRLQNYAMHSLSCCKAGADNLQSAWAFPTTSTVVTHVARYF